MCFNYIYKLLNKKINNYYNKEEKNIINNYRSLKNSPCSFGIYNCNSSSYVDSNESLYKNKFINTNNLQKNKYISYVEYCVTNII